MSRQTNGLVRLPTVLAAFATSAILSALCAPSARADLIDKLAAPTLNDVQTRVTTVVAQANTDIGSQIDHVGGVVTKAGTTLVGQVNTDLSGQLADANGIMTARIAQVESGADEAVSRAIGEVDVEQRKVFANANLTIKAIDGDAKQRLEQVDQILESRIDQADGVVQGAIVKVDEDAKERITQVDEAATRQVGSVDVVASKQSLSLQIALLQVGALLGIIAFLVAAFRYVFEHAPEHSRRLKAQKLGDLSRRMWVAGASAGWVLVHLVIGVAAVGLLYLGTKIFPQSAEKQQTALIATHKRALVTSLEALDFTMVKYHATLLAIIDPDDQAKNIALERRADLIRTILTRPGLLATGAGRRQVLAAIDEVALAEQVAFKPAEVPSPDLLTARCYVDWQTAQTRSDEIVAVKGCVAALTHDPASNDAPAKNDPRFVLRSLAVHYVDLFSQRPPASALDPSSTPFDAAAMRALVASNASSATPLLGDATTYDKLVLTLDAASSSAFVAMLEAEADVRAAWATLSDRERATWTALAKRPAPPESALESAAPALHAALATRTKSALAMMHAWSDFDHALQASPDLVGSTLALAVFSLNDAPLAQGLWYQSQPNDPGAASAVAASSDPRQRAMMAPIRVRWAARYLSALGSGVERVAANEEADRYLKKETATLAFSNALIDYRLARMPGAKDTSATTLGAKRDAAAIAAAAIGLYAQSSKGSALYASTLLAESSAAIAPSKEVVAGVAQASNLARLRLF
jgi:hypothetical protein